MVIPSEKNDKIIIARSIDNDIQTTGSVSAGDTKVVTIIAKNNTSSTIKLNVGVSSSEKSTDSIEYLGGKKLISGTTAEADYYYDEATAKYIKTTDSSITFTTNSTTYSYTGSSQTFTPNHDGSYKLEAWGAQGGSYDETYYGGYGAYAVGVIDLKKNTKLFLTVGGTSKFANNSSISGGYNGGGNAKTSSTNDSAGGGGGATHITTSEGVLSSLEEKKGDIILVAGGGGGAYYYSIFNSIGGHAGGIKGSLSPDGTCGDNRTLYKGIPSNQSTAGTGTGCGLEINKYNTSFGKDASFGQGQSLNDWSSGGGGGYYGGGAGYAHGGNGGSSYIGNPLLTNKAMYCYNCEESTITSTKTISVTAVSTDPIANSAKKGNGAAKITPIVPTISTPSTIILNYQLKSSDITCKDNGSGCKVVRISDTSVMTSGTKSIAIIVKDDLGYLYKYVKTITIGTSSKLLSSVSAGSYVKYTGNNGCSGKSCEGQNANYVSDNDMGYCDTYSNKFTVSGWRIAYINETTAYLISAGAPECLATDANGTVFRKNVSSSFSETTDNLPKHLENLKNEALKYCNKLYAYGGVCNDNSTWGIKEEDFKKITNASSLSSCHGVSESSSCGYNNSLIDNGSFYWFNNLRTSTTLFRWAPTYRFVNDMSSFSAGGVRPIIRLKSTVKEIGGTGTYQDPYIISP